MTQLVAKLMCLDVETGLLLYIDAKDHVFRLPAGIGKKHPNVLMIRDVPATSCKGGQHAKKLRSHTGQP
jgi:hypothetical protein